MSETFNKLKRKFLITAVLKSLAAGLAAGFFLIGAVLLPVKLTKSSLHAGYFALIGLAGFVVVAAVVFLCLYRSDKRLAKNIDTKYALGEKIQTMLEYRGEEGAIVELQRGNASEVLGSLPLVKPWWKRFGLEIIALVVGVALAITAIVLPVAKAPDAGAEPPPKEFVITAWQKAAFLQLMSDVESTELDSGLKESEAVILQSLYDGLQEKQTEDTMTAAVVAAIGLTDALFAETYTYRAVASAVYNGGLKALALAIANNISVYRGSGVNLALYDQVKARATIIADVVGANIQKSLIDSESSYRNDFAVAADEGLNNVVIDSVMKLDTAFSALKVAEDETLRGILQDFYDGLNDIYGKTNSYSDAYLQDGIDKLFSALTVALSEEVHLQSYRCLINEFIRYRLISIFNLPTDLVPLLNLEVAGLNDDTIIDDPSGNGPGGAGSGDILYGSDDYIFDPDRGELVKYGEVLNEYYARVVEQLRNNPDIPDDLKTSIYKYFELLYGASDD